MEFRDYYKTLGVERTATEAEIRSAYRKLARKYHPDVNPNNKQAEQRFKEINEAYQVLGDPAKRKKYDQLGADWERGEAEEEMRRRYAGAEGFGRSGAASATDFSDFFESFFGGSGGGAFSQSRPRGFNFSAGAQRAPDAEAEIPVTLEEAFRGTTRRVTLTAEDECQTCQGQGVIFQQESRGKTRVVRAAKTCATCGGSGVVPQRRTLEISIPAGASEGTRLRLKGQGGHGPRPELNGDLYVTVRLLPHRVFTVNGRDIKCELPVWDYEAALGADVTVPTVDSRLSLKIPPRSQTGRVMRVKGRGLPARGSEPAGDLLYELKVLAPDDLTDDERKLMAELAERRRERGVGDPRAALFRS